MARRKQSALDDSSSLGTVVTPSDFSRAGRPLKKARTNSNGEFYSADISDGSTHNGGSDDEDYVEHSSDSDGEGVENDIVNKKVSPPPEFIPRDTGEHVPLSTCESPDAEESIVQSLGEIRELVAQQIQEREEIQQFSVEVPGGPPCTMQVSIKFEQNEANKGKHVLGLIDDVTDRISLGGVVIRSEAYWPSFTSTDEVQTGVPGGLFSRLPRELRDQIYSHVFYREQPIDFGDPKDTFSLSGALLSTCSMIHEEGIQVLVKSHLSC